MTVPPDTALTESLAVGPDIDAESWRLNVPARAACYVLEDADHQPIIAATVGDLRGALMRRLGPDATDDADETTHRKIDYRAVTRFVRYRRVYSRFEGHRAYLENVRQLFPDSYKRLIRGWRAWWVTVDPDASHPRFEAKDRPLGPPGTCYGPLPTNKSARRLVETLEDTFDLCRYHNILTQAPDGEACAYKQMGRCPAPCDGTIPMDDYRAQVTAAVAMLDDGPDAWREDTTAQMHAAAADRDYEHAARLKAKLDAAVAIDAPQTRFVRPVTDFRFVSLQHGDRKGRVRIFLIAHGRIEYAGQLDPTNREELLPQIAVRLQAPGCSEANPGDPGIESIGLVAWHLLSGQRERGRFIRAARLPDAAALDAAVDAFIDAKPRRPASADVEDVSSETPDSATT